MLAAVLIPSGPSKSSGVVFRNASAFPKASSVGANTTAPTGSEPSALAMPAARSSLPASDTAPATAPSVSSATAAPTAADAKRRMQALRKLILGVVVGGG